MVAGAEPQPERSQPCANPSEPQPGTDLIANTELSLRDARFATGAPLAAPGRGGAAGPGSGQRGELRAPPGRDAGHRPGLRSPLLPPGCSPPQVRRPAVLPLCPDGGTAVPQTPGPALAALGDAAKTQEGKSRAQSPGGTVPFAPRPQRGAEEGAPRHGRAPSTPSPSPEERGVGGTDGRDTPARRGAPLLTAVLQAAARSAGEAPPPRPVPAALHRPRPSAPTSEPRPRS